MGFLLKIFAGKLATILVIGAIGGSIVGGAYLAHWYKAGKYKYTIHKTEKKAVKTVDKQQKEIKDEKSNFKDSDIDSALTLD